MRRLVLLLPFALVLAALANTFWLLALIAGVPYQPYDAALEGARILAERASLTEGAYPSGYDILLAGTSRTMADFNAHATVDELRARCGLQRLSGYNLGNVADEYSSFRAHLNPDALPKLLVLEFSPHVLLASAPEPAPAPSGLSYRGYRIRVTIAETYFSGFVQAAFGIGERVTVRPGEALRLAHAVGGGHILARAYYLLREGQGFGSRMEEGGQVLYRTYLPDRSAAVLLGDAASEYRTYQALLAARPDPESLRGLTETLALFGDGRQIVVVRPPVDPRLYALENAMQHDLIDTVIGTLRDRRVAYIDLNPGDYQSTDWSHIDWYDTDRLSRVLGDRLAAVVGPGILAPDARCRAQ